MSVYIGDVEGEGVTEGILIASYGGWLNLATDLGPRNVYASDVLFVRVHRPEDVHDEEIVAEALRRQNTAEGREFLECAHKAGILGPLPPIETLAEVDHDLRMNGHGHVLGRNHGKAPQDCGGVTECKVCAAELARLEAAELRAIEGES